MKDYEKNEQEDYEIKDYELKLMENFDLSLIEIKIIIEQMNYNDGDFDNIDEMIEYVRMAGVYYNSMYNNPNFNNSSIYNFLSDVRMEHNLNSIEFEIMVLLSKYEIDIIKTLIIQTTV